MTREKAIEVLENGAWWDLLIPITTIEGRKSDIELHEALDIDIVNGVLAIGCFGCGEYTPISELMKLHLNDAVPIVRCKDCKSYKKSGEYEDENGEIKEYWYCEFHSLPKNLVQMQSDDFCSYGERKEN